MGLFDVNPKKYTQPAFVIQLGFMIFVLIIICKLIDLQIIKHKHLEELASNMRQTSKKFTLRGEIVDRNGVRLAADTTLYDVYAHPKYYNIDPKDIAAELSPIVKMPKATLYKMLNTKIHSTITIKKDIDRTTMLQIKKLKIRGMDIVKKNERVYPQGKLASHVLGYVNDDANLYAGVESTAMQMLISTPKINPIEYDGRGNVIYDFNTDPTYTAAPLQGKKITLTIDSTIQHLCEVELQKMITKTHAKRGTVIVMNPKNGEILAFAILPNYNPEKYNKFSQEVIKNWVLSDVYPPGSTFKILTIASALETGAITPGVRILDTGKIEIQGWPITNYDFRKHPFPGSIDLRYLFEHSSNVGSAKVALMMPKSDHYNMLKSFNFGSKTGIDLPGESAGILPPPRTWDTVRQATIGFGYSIASTPIQVAAAVAAIANDGVWITPHIIKYDEKTALEKIKSHRVLKVETAKSLTRILAASIQQSKSTAGKIPDYKVAGKTGTSRKPNPFGPGYLEGQVFTSFAGYFPAENPQVLIMVVVDDPRGADIWGSTVAGPVFNAIATEISHNLNLKQAGPVSISEVKKLEAKRSN